MSLHVQDDERLIRAGEGGGEASVDQLREDVENALAEAALAQERQQLLQLEVGGLQHLSSSFVGFQTSTEHAMIDLFYNQGADCQLTTNEQFSMQ